MSKNQSQGTILEIVRFEPAKFDALLRGNGVLMSHFRAIKCPLGVTDKFDARAHGDHSNCSNGFIYKHAGDVTVAFMGNGSTATLEDMGLVDGSTTTISLPRFYDSPKGEEIAVQHFDRFFLKEIAATSVNTQLIEAHITGVDRLQYKAVEVEHLIDADGIEYGPDDYRIEDGRIVWTGKRPPYDPKENRGTVYSIRYRYIPFWYVKNIIHEVRICRVYDYVKSQDQLERMPHQVQLQREYMFENEQRSTDGKSDMRDVKAPRSGSFGPR